MKISIISTSHKLDSWLEQAMKNLLIRFNNHWNINLIQLKPSNKPQTVLRMQEEAKNMHKQLANYSNYALIILDEQGQDLSTKQLAHKINKWDENYSNLVFVIGGADGIDVELKKHATVMIKLSSMTLTHGMAKLLLIEQLYRSWSINNNHPYHRD